MKRITLAWALTLCSFITFIACSSPDVGERNVSIIPAPAQMTVGEGTFTIHPGIEIGYADESLKGMGELLSNEIEKLSGIKLASASDKESNCIIFLELTDPKEFADLPKAYGLSPKDSVPVDESYSLSIQKRNIYIKATTLEGIYRGITTLKQIVGGNLQPGGEKIYLPLLEVKDAPRFAWRGLSFDVSRCFFDPEEVKQVIDMVALYKMNVLHMHLSDNQGWRIEIKKYPELAEIGGQLPNNGRKGGYYTQEEFKDLVNYANERFITIIPEVDIPGHTAAVFAAYPDFKNAVKFKTKVNIPGQAFNALDVDDPKAMQFTEDVIAELAALAPGNYIHIGGDEAIGLPHDKFVRFINKTREIVLKNGKKMVGWQETARADISEGDVIQHWIYLKQKSENSSKKKDNIPAEYKEIMALFAEFMKEAPKDPGLGISKKAKVILSPSGYVYLDHKYLEPSADSTQNAEQERLGMAAYEKQTIQEMYDWDPMTFNPTVENPQKDVAAIEAAIWCETITNFRDLQFLLMPRLAGVAEKGWSKVENTHWDEYKVRLGAQAPLWEKADWNYFKSSLVDWK